MDAEREASCTPPLPLADDLLPEQLSKFHSPSMAGSEQEERQMSPPTAAAAAAKPALADTPSVTGPADVRRKDKEKSVRKSKDEGGKRGKKPDDSTSHRQSSKEISSNESEYKKKA